jgi:hypothetical protein
MSIKTVLMERDGLTEKQAQRLIEQAKDDLADKLESGEGDPYYFCEEAFGLEPDFIEELM